LSPEGSAVISVPKEKSKVLIAQQRIHPADVNQLDLDYGANIVGIFVNTKVDDKKVNHISKNTTYGKRKKSRSS